MTLQLLGLSDITAIGGVLSALTLLTACKVSTDIIFNEPGRI